MIKNSEFSKDDIQKIYKTIGKNVKRIREEKGISQLNLAMAIGHKSVGVISNCELCLQNKHFNIAPADLFGQSAGVIRTVLK